MIPTTIENLLDSLRRTGAPHFANDSIGDLLTDDDRMDIELAAAAAIRNLMRCLLIDIDGDHNTQETAERVARMYVREVFKGRYEPRPKVTSFPNAKALDELYCTGPITIRSACSHHLVPITGQAWIGIIPGERVIGLSKFNRLVEWVAARPQIQEELVVQIADLIEELCAPKGLGVVVKATHMCMTWRGVKESAEAVMTTSVMRGALRDKPEARAEFLTLAGL